MLMKDYLLTETPGHTDENAATAERRVGRAMDVYDPYTPVQQQ